MKSLLLCLCTILPVSLLQQRSYTVGDILKTARQLSNDSVIVQLTGYITRNMGNNIYLFEDRTAEIKLEIERKYLPARPLPDKELVVIRGWVQYEMNKPVTLRVNRPVEPD